MPLSPHVRGPPTTPYPFLLIWVFTVLNCMFLLSVRGWVRTRPHLACVWRLQAWRARCSRGVISCMARSGPTTPFCHLGGTYCSPPWSVLGDSAVADQDATEAFYSPQRHRVLKQPQYVHLRYCTANNEPVEFIKQPNDGLIGMAFGTIAQSRQLTFFENLIKEHNIAAPLFSVHLSRHEERGSSVCILILRSVVSDC